MKFPKKTATEEVIQKISRLKGPNKGLQGAVIWMGSALANQDANVQRRSARMTHDMRVALNRAFPEVNRQLIGDIVADLSSLWDSGQKLDKELKRLFQMRFPQHRNHLGEFLSSITVNQIEMPTYWIGNLRKRVPKLRKALDRQERKKRRSGRTKLSTHPKKLVAQTRVQ